MKNLVPALFLIALLCAVALAQNTPPAPSSEPGASQQQPATPAGQPASGAAANAATNPSQPKNNPLKIAPGSVIPVELAKTVDAKKAKTGEEVVATVTHGYEDKHWRGPRPQGHKNYRPRYGSAAAEQRAEGIGAGYRLRSCRGERRPDAASHVDPGRDFSADQ